jgi:AcrR family transcriptional regulator
VAEPGLRERKKSLMRQQLSDTAARMFLERGFDAVRVAEVAAACGVSTKTVFNYFPTKEALVLDRLEGTMTALRAGLADPAVAPLDAALGLLAGELDDLTAAMDAAPDPGPVMSAHRRFGDLIRTTPALRAYRNDVMDRFVAVAAEALAARDGRDPADPGLQVAAAALLGLWRVQFDSVRRHLDGSPVPAALRRAVTADVRRAADVLAAGLGPVAQRQDAPGA